MSNMVKIVVTNRTRNDIVSALRCWYTTLNDKSKSHVQALIDRIDSLGTCDPECVTGFNFKVGEVLKSEGAFSYVRVTGISIKLVYGKPRNYYDIESLSGLKSTLEAKALHNKYNSEYDQDWNALVKAWKGA